MGVPQGKGFWSVQRQVASEWDMSALSIECIALVLSFPSHSLTHMFIMRMSSMNILVVRAPNQEGKNMTVLSGI